MKAHHEEDEEITVINEETRLAFSRFKMCGDYQDSYLVINLFKYYET